LARPRYILGFVLVWAASLIGILLKGTGAYYAGYAVMFVVVPIWCVFLILALFTFAILRRAVRRLDR
jgi:hypothetical protein